MNPSDLILVPPYAGGLLFWPVSWILSKNRGPLFWQLGRIFGWTAAGIVLLASGHWLLGLFASARSPLLHFIPVVNFVSLLLSLAACFQASTGRLRLLLQRHFIAAAGIPGFTLMVMYLVGGCKNVDIGLHEGRAIATVIPSESGGRKTIHYSYEVDGQTYAGSGDPGNPPYPPGSTFEIRYCTLHPSISTARHPFEFVGIICVGSAFAGVASFMASRSKRWNRCDTVLGGP